MQNKIKRNIIAILVSRVFILILLAVTGITLVRILGPSQIGSLISIYIIPSMLIRLTMLGSRKTAITYLIKKEYSDNEIVTSLFFIWIFSSSVAVFICMVNFAIMQHTDMNVLTLIYILSAIPLRLFIVYSNSVFLGKFKLNYSSLFKFLPDLFNVFIIIICVYLNILTIDIAIATYFFSSLFIAILCILLLILNFNIKFEYNKQIIKELSSVGLISAVAFFIMQLNYRFDIVLLYKYTTNYDVGIYSIGTAFSFALWLIPDAIGLIVKNKILKSTDPFLLKFELASLLRISLMFGILIGLIMYFLAPFLVSFIFGNNYVQSAIIFRNILPGVFFFIIFRTLIGNPQLFWLPGFIIKIFVPTLIINIIANIYLIPLYGSIGAAWATNLSYTIGAIAILIMFSLKMKISLMQIFSFNKNDFSFIKKLTKIGSRKN